MAGIYIHIPFCKQACHYCDFHFSTSLAKRDAMVEAICKEIGLRKGEVHQEVHTIYFGGGTPSLLILDELDRILDTVYKNFTVVEDPEITLEANPDDLHPDTIRQLAASRINRLSIGVQSFFEEDLKLMNRAHNAEEARTSIEEAKKYFDNISIDLIYGIPGMSLNRWEQNLETAMEFQIPHLSCYALTVEPKTALKKFIEKGVVAAVDDEESRRHHDHLLSFTETRDYVNYEFSNFGKAGFFSRNNTAYWMGQSYLGIGPSAHSYDGNRRSWNVANNSLYIKGIESGTPNLEREVLSRIDKYNEFVMTRLRTMWGVSLEMVSDLFGTVYKQYLEKQLKPHLEEHLLFMDGDIIKVSKKGKFLTDGIAADLFLVNLERNDTY